MIKVNQEYIDLVMANLKLAYEKEYENILIRPKITEGMARIILSTAYLVGLAIDIYRCSGEQEEVNGV